MNEIYFYLWNDYLTRDGCLLKKKNQNSINKMANVSAILLVCYK